MKDVDLYFTEGDAEFSTGRTHISRELAIKGIFQPKGTKIVQVDVSRNTSPADIYGPIAESGAAQDGFDHLHLAFQVGAGVQQPGDQSGHVG